MGTYRLEEAPSSRAGCQNKECKEQKVKIQKGELRIGTWVEGEKFQSFVWRHWGCVTPKLISNIVDSLEDAGMEPTELDGFDELSEEFQEKVLKAIGAGHVDDADWKGDVEMNRPGKAGFRVRGGSKKEANADAIAEADEPEEKPKQPKSKRRAVKADAGDGDEEGPTAKKPKKRSRAKKPASDDEEAESEQERPAPKKSRASRASAKSEKPTRKQRQKKSAEDEDEGEELVEEKPKRRGRKRAVKSD